MRFPKSLSEKITKEVNIKLIVQTEFIVFRSSLSFFSNMNIASSGTSASFATLSFKSNAP